MIKDNACACSKFTHIEVTVENQSLWFTPLFVFTTTCTMELANVSELSSTEKYE